jgi:hypothetical protein
MRLQSAVFWWGVPTLGLLVAGACSNKEDVGFGNQGTQRDGPAQDTGPWNVDTGPEDTGETETENPDDTGETGDSEPEDTGFDMEGDGYAQGKTAHNLIANDQTDTEWRLYRQFSGLEPPPWNATVLVFGAAYNDHFVTISGWLQAILDQANTLASSQGTAFSVSGAVFLIDDSDGVQADKDAAAAWASANGLGTVLYESSPSRPITTSWHLYYQSKTKIFLIGPDMGIKWVADSGHTNSDRLYEKIEDMILQR